MDLLNEPHWPFLPLTTQGKEPVCVLYQCSCASDMFSPPLVQFADMEPGYTEGWWYKYNPPKFSLLEIKSMHCHSCYWLMGPSYSSVFCSSNKSKGHGWSWKRMMTFLFVINLTCACQGTPAIWIIYIIYPISIITLCNYLNRCHGAWWNSATISHLIAGFCFFFFNNERDKCSKTEIKAKILNSAVFSVKA